MSLMLDYALFIIKIITIIIFVMIVIILIINIIKRKDRKHKEFTITSLNKIYERTQDFIFSVKMDSKSYKIWQKRNKHIKNKNNKNNKLDINEENNFKPTLYVLDFKGSTTAHEVSALRKEISAIISVIEKNDQVLLRLESPGGIVNGYGLAASQLERFRKKNIYLTISVDKIAASGGYMMACVANYIIAAPFAIIGSIGVVSLLPNFNKLLKQYNIDIEMHTAGQYKRTLTMFGENTDIGRKKFCNELNLVHSLFKNHISYMRPKLNINDVSNGEYWFGSVALGKKLIDSINTSDDFLMEKVNTYNILHIRYNHKKNILDTFVKKIFNQIYVLIINILNKKIIHDI